MLKVSDLVTSLRYALGDMQGAAISDFELIEALNNAAALLFTRMGQRFIYSARKRTLLIVDENEKSAPLPSDFNGVYKVGMGEEGEARPVTYIANKHGKYHITGNVFYAPAGAYGLEYYYLPAKIYNLTDYLDAPEGTELYLKNIAEALLKKDAALAAQIADLCCDVSAGANISHYPDIGTVQILGGKL